MLVEMMDATIGYGSDIVKEHLSFTINEGDFTVIIGSNGAGKSTLVKTMLGIIPLSKGTMKSNLKAGYLSQKKEYMKNFPASVEEVVRSGFVGKSKGIFYSKAEKEMARQLLNELHIEHLAKKAFGELSGGQQQRVLLARAILASDNTLILDEMTTGLDEETIKITYDMLDTLHSQGKSIIMIAHDVERATAHATHILNMDLGTYVAKEDK